MAGGDYTTARLVLRSSEADVAAVAGRPGWARIEGMAADEEFEERSWRANDSVAVHWMSDRWSGNCVIEVSGKGPADAQRLLAELSTELDAEIPDDLIDAVDHATDPEELGRRVHRMTLAAPLDADDRVLARVERCLQHPETIVRLVTLHALLNTAWPQYRQPLARLIAVKQDDSVRTMTEDILATYDEAGVPADSS